MQSVCSIWMKYQWSHIETFINFIFELMIYKLFQVIKFCLCKKRCSKKVEDEENTGGIVQVKPANDEEDD